MLHGVWISIDQGEHNSPLGLNEKTQNELQYIRIQRRCVVIHQ